MLNLLLGLSEERKSEEILNRICSDARAGVGGQILLVPEQYSHETERLLCKAGGNSVCLFAEVLTFRRLASRVLAQAGGLGEKQLDEGGRLLLMQLAVRSLHGKLTVFFSAADRPGFLKELIGAVDELKCWRVTPEAMEAAAEKADGVTSAKLRDLSLVLSTYDALAANAAADPRDILERVAEKLDRCSFARGARIYADGFSGFTAQELHILEKLMKKAERMTVSLTCGELFADTELFSRARDTAARLIRLSQRAGTGYKIETCKEETHGKKEFRYLLGHLYDYGSKPFEGDCKGIMLYTAENPFSECEHAASYILEQVRDQGLRFRDIAVMAGSFEDYSALIETVFERYGVPVFLDKKEDVLQKPVMTHILSAMDAVSGGFTYEPMFRYLKSGLADLTNEECDLLENYALLWEIRGSMWTGRNPWSLSPRGYAEEMTEEDRKLLERLNALREKVTGPLLRVKRSTSGRCPARRQAEALYAFMEETRLREHIETRESRLRRTGKLKQADEYRQLWQILCGGLEQCALILGDMPMELEEFSQLFRLVLSNYDVGTIPVSMDSVAAGPMERMRRRRARCVVVLGANDGSLPPAGGGEGIFSDGDRELLRTLGIELGPGGDELAQQELDIIYSAFALPRDRLLVSWPRSSSSGARLSPSFLIRRIRLLFPGLKPGTEGETGESFRLSAPEPCFELAAGAASRTGRAGENARAAAAYLKRVPEYADRLARAGDLSALSRGPLSRKASAAVFGETVRMSASRMEKYRTCRYAYFLQYGLKAKPRRTAGFEAPEIGTYLHYILENTVRRVMELGGFAKTDRAEVRRISREFSVSYASEALGGLEGKTARFRYLFNRLQRLTDRIMDNLADELSASEFQPLDFELRFADDGDIPAVRVGDGDGAVRVTGFADRVDGWIDKNRLYVRIVDYKTGIKSFNLTDIWHGLGVQMLLYLFALEANGASRYGKEVVPAGVLYVPVREAAVQAERHVSDEELSKRMADTLKRSGIVLDRPEVIEAMEKGVDGEARFIPVKINKDGFFSGVSSVASLEQFGKLRRHMEKLLFQIGADLKKGRVEADPYQRGLSQSACDFCDFKDACLFDPTAGTDKPRFLYSVSRERFWELIGEEDGK